MEGEQRSDDHLARNEAGTVPVLELDDGEYLTESLPIMEFLEELYPQPVMIGATPEERARTRAFERHVDMCILMPITRIVHATRSPLGLPPSEEVAARERDRLAVTLPRVDARVGEGPFAMGDAPTIVDCTLFAALQFGEFFGVQLPGDCANLQAWYQRYKAHRAALS